MRTRTTALTARIMATAADTLRRRLDELGRRRAEHDGEGDELAAEIRKALADSSGVIPKTEVAERLGLHRTTLYRVYG